MSRASTAITVDTSDDLPRPTPIRPGLRQHLVWLFVAFAYLSVFPYFPELNNPNENVRVYMTRALVEQHQLDIAKVESQWGWVNDKAKNVTRTGTRLYSSKAPGVSLLGVPVLAVQTWLWHARGWPSPSKLASIFALRIFAVVLPLIWFFWAWRRYVQRLSESSEIADLLLVAVAFGSLLFPYGVQFVGHSLAAAASFASFMALAPHGTITSDKKRALLAGLLAGLGVLFEYQNVLVAALLAAYVLVRRPRLLPLFVLGALPMAAILGTFHTLCFGHPWDFPYGHLENSEFQANDHGRGFYGLSLPAGRALLGVLFQPGFGLLACSPFLVLAALAVGYMVMSGPRAEGLLCASIALVLWFFLAGIPNWRGGWSVGPRYIAAVVPYLAIAFAFIWPRFSRHRLASLGWAICAGLVVASVAVNGMTAVVYPQSPPQVRNPLFQIFLPLVAAGFAPYSMGRLLGLHRAWSLLPTGLAILGATTVALAPLFRRWRQLGLRRWTGAVGVLVAMAYLVPFAMWPRVASPAERAALSFIEKTWAPRSNSGTSP